MSEFARKAPSNVHKEAELTTIASCYHTCVQGFRQLDNVLRSYTADVTDIGLQSPELLQQLRENLHIELFGRFKMWAGNCGAHRTGRASLDYRLREALHLHQQVVHLLNCLERALVEGGFYDIPYDGSPRICEH